MAGRRLIMIKVCEGCHKEFHPWSRGQRFCSRPCAGNHPLKTRICEYCGKSFQRSRAALKRRKHIYCSRKCYVASRRIVLTCATCGKIFERTVSTTKPERTYYCSKDCRDKGLVVEKPILTCAFCSKQFERYPSEIKKMSERGYRHVFCSHKCRAAMISAQFDPPHPYNGSTGPTPKGRNNSEYKKWRKAVYQKDAYVCQDCGAQNVLVCAHHFKSFLLYPKLRYDVSNGITLCFPCHHKRHSLNHSSHSHQPP